MIFCIIVCIIFNRRAVQHGKILIQKAQTYAIEH